MITQLVIKLCYPNVFTETGPQVSLSCNKFFHSEFFLQVLESRVCLCFSYLIWQLHAARYFSWFTHNNNIRVRLSTGILKWSISLHSLLDHPPPSPQGSSPVLSHILSTAVSHESYMSSLFLESCLRITHTWSSLWCDSLTFKLMYVLDCKMDSASQILTTFFRKHLRILDKRFEILP